MSTPLVVPKACWIHMKCSRGMIDLYLQAQSSDWKTAVLNKVCWIVLDENFAFHAVLKTLILNYLQGRLVNELKFVVTYRQVYPFVLIKFDRRFF